jgi:hypothetical protein
LLSQRIRSAPEEDPVFQPLRRSIFGAWVATALVACGGASHKDLIRVEQVPRDNTHCPTGGAAVESGADHNDNGTLDADEVATTAYICNGASLTGEGNGEHATLVRVQSEAAGANCAQGGVAILAGVDGNGNGMLDDNEVASTSYVCDGAGGALVRVTNEPPGSHCLRGGTAIATGVDTDHDGMLEPGEITNTSYLCNPASVPPAGDVTIHAAADLLQLTGVARIDGNLVIDAADLTAVDLPSLVTVEGNLTVTASAVTSIKLPKLVRVGSTLDVEAPMLTELSLPALVRANRVTLKGGNGVALNLGALTEVAGLFSIDSMKLANFPDLTGWPLTHVGAFELRLVTGFGRVTLPTALQVDGTLGIYGSDISNLTGHLGVHGDVEVMGNDLLSWCDFSGRVDGSLSIEQNKVLHSIGMPSANKLYVSGNEGLQSLSLAFDTIDSIDIGSNDKLVEILGSGLTSARSISISWNDSLTTLKLPQLRWASQMDVQGNPKLPSCLKATFDAQLAGSGVSADWYGNDDQATCN